MKHSRVPRYTRRRLLKQAAGGATAAPFLGRSKALGSDHAVAASERINLGFIGVGSLGQWHVRVFQEDPDIQVVAICDVDTWRRENATKEVEEKYAAATRSGQYRGCAAYKDFRELLARDDIDAVVITTGDRWHPVLTVLAAQAGKDIYCEKPISLTIREARVMLDVVRRYDRVFQTGLQQRSTGEFRRACKLVQEGRLGKLKIVYPNLVGTSQYVNLPPEPVPAGLDWDMWLGPAPWHPFNGRFHRYGKPKGVVPWSFCRDFGGGQMTDGTVHNVDIVQWGLGMDHSGPVEIIPPGVNGAASLTYRYANGVPVEVVDWKLDEKKHFIPEGWDVNTKFLDFSVLFVGELGWIYAGRKGLLQAYPEEILAEWGGSKTVQQGYREIEGPIVDHHRNWVEAIRTRQQPVADVEIGARSTMVSHLGNIALWTGRALKWDPRKEEFLGDEEANRLRSRAMRQPWRI